MSSSEVAASPACGRREVGVGRNHSGVQREGDMDMERAGAKKVGISVEAKLNESVTIPPQDQDGAQGEAISNKLAGEDHAARGWDGYDLSIPDWVHGGG